MALISEGKFVEDEWRHLADEEDLPRSGKIVVSQQRLEEALAGLGPEQGLGVRLPNTADPAAIAPYFSRLSLIAIAFPAFTDGRGFSLARLVRRAGFKGELRASGRLVADQALHARQCGFDTIEIPHDIAQRQNEAQWAKALGSYAETYQEGYGTRGSILERRRKAAL
ncbi:DUF934 domain-containing protein [Methylocystis heyeri]|uniref:DUF934 domain-containing protein n=1 Tax=Methylocystis heyeri TaxID=391905 RepID=A0A6B8KAM3_9HYPH|nr:DUF934 domain-containing protein [Methylocystis heyeri]QGM45364.1 DUF934 domain-containing protein [Methylocystis heyeri]